MPRLRVSRNASLDLVEIFAYIAEDNLTAARRMNAKFAETFTAIAQQPGNGREAFLFRRKSLHQSTIHRSDRQILNRMQLSVVRNVQYR